MRYIISKDNKWINYGKKETLSAEEALELIRNLINKGGFHKIKIYKLEKEEN